MSVEEISDGESRLFRRLRPLWLASFILIVLAMVLNIGEVVWFFVSVHLLLAGYIIFWPCPRCARLFCVESFLWLSIVWPYRDSCLTAKPIFISTYKSKGACDAT